ncbi:MAG: low molecular weight phosphatase family protein [Ruminococcus sp.]|nr:low molecular weight phosphatase family protein [Ruminococcus sp.]
MKRILFVCTGNTCRSPMAEGIFNLLAKENNINYIAESAGLVTRTGLSYSENSVKACKEIGVDIENGQSVFVKDVDLKEYDLFVPMSVSHAQSLVSLSVPKDKVCLLKSNGISDPYGGDLEVYRKCCLEIKDAVINLIEKL